MLVRRRVHRQRSGPAPPRSRRSAAPSRSPSPVRSHANAVVGKRVCTTLCSSAKSSDHGWSTSAVSGPPAHRGQHDRPCRRRGRCTASTISVVVPGAGQRQHGVVATARPAPPRRRPSRSRRSRPARGGRRTTSRTNAEVPQPITSIRRPRAVRATRGRARRPPAATSAAGTGSRPRSPSWTAVCARYCSVSDKVAHEVRSRVSIVQGARAGLRTGAIRAPPRQVVAQLPDLRRRSGVAAVLGSTMAAARHQPRISVDGRPHGQLAGPR